MELCLARLSAQFNSLLWKWFAFNINETPNPVKRLCPTESLQQLLKEASCMFIPIAAVSSWDCAMKISLSRTLTEAEHFYPSIEDDLIEEYFDNTSSVPREAFGNSVCFPHSSVVDLILCSIHGESGPEDVREYVSGQQPKFEQLRDLFIKQWSVKSLRFIEIARCLGKQVVIFSNLDTDESLHIIKTARLEGQVTLLDLRPRNALTSFIKEHQLKNIHKAISITTMRDWRLEKKHIAFQDRTIVVKGRCKLKSRVRAGPQETIQVDSFDDLTRCLIQAHFDKPPIWFDGWYLENICKTSSSSTEMASEQENNDEPSGRANRVVRFGDEMGKPLCYTRLIEDFD
jgi:hypothetical protein